MRITIVSDTHLSRRTPEAQTNWDAVVAHVAAGGSELVLHVGDLSLDGAGDADDLAYARRELDRLPAPWHVVPGNHDIGDNPSGASQPISVITDERLERWRSTLGMDHWCLRVDGWTWLAVDAQLFGSGLAAERVQWRWLEEQLSEVARARELLALITHKPLAAAAAELAAAPSYRFVPTEARKHLAALLRAHACELALVVSGHVHQYRVLQLAGTQHLWAPSTWAVLPERIQPTLGTKSCGIVSIELGASGKIDVACVEPTGLRQLTLYDDIPDPYHAH